MNKAMQKLLGIAVIAVVVIGTIVVGGVGYNEDSNFTVIQYRLGGDPVVKADNGMFFKWFGVTDVYPDKDIIYFSKDPREGSKDDESIPTLFTDKGKGWWDFQVTVRNPTSESDQVDFHRMVKGDYENYRNALNARLKDAGRKYAESKTASEAAEAQSDFKAFVEDALMNDNILDTEFHSKVISVELTGVDFDPKTDELFATQQESLLLKKQADIDAEKFTQQTLSTKAEYAQKTAQAKGEADMIAMTATTDAEREAKLATIEAQRKVDVQELEKLEAQALSDKMAIDAQAVYLVAEIDANAKLMVAEIAKMSAIEEASAIVALAEAEEEKIRLAGAMTEQERVRLEIQKEQNIGVADAWANGNRLTPDFIISGGGEGGNVGDINSTLFSMKLMESMGMLDSTNGVAKVTR
jgi:hypothetical protein